MADLKACSICGGGIEVEGNGWAEGHNAEPIIAEGRACGLCNAEFVIPVRIAQMSGKRSLAAENLIRFLREGGARKAQV